MYSRGFCTRDIGGERRDYVAMESMEISASNIILGRKENRDLNANLFSSIVRRIKDWSRD